MSSLLLSAHSECRVWSSSVAAVLPSGLSSLPEPQLCSPPGRSGGRLDAGRSCSAELRAAAPGAVPVLDIFLCLHLVCALRGFLEHFCLQPAWCATAPTTMSCLLEAQTTLYPFYSSLGGCLTAWLDESPPAFANRASSRGSQSCLTAPLLLHPVLRCNDTWHAAAVYVTLNFFWTRELRFMVLWLSLTMAPTHNTS